MKEKLAPNKVEPTLFVGLGGIGSRIVKGVRERAKNDDLRYVQFVTMDTDVNDLERLEKGPSVLTIQTSSSRSVAAYLRNDKAAKEEWFPENKILDGKTVSEGAGQVRAISRLALNATIKQGRIATLYEAIDNLFLKDGGNKSRAVKVVIVSTATGGTGSGITLPLALLIRHYLAKNYPESAAIIRGFLVMPSVMDTVIKTESERLSQRRNGYATIKEINAFMMKGSSAFDYDPRLRRYSDLHIKLPTTASSDIKLAGTPFDFCFLLERVDALQKNMDDLGDYEEYAAQCIYEQNIGNLKKQAASKEDNIIKEFTDPAKHGRNRFGGVGASIIRYPYEDVRDYIAYDWAQNAVLGVTSAKELSDKEREERAEEGSWMMYDYKFNKLYKQWQADPNSNVEDEPKRSKVYISEVSNGTDNFTKNLRDRYFQKKINVLKKKSTNVSDDANDFRSQMEKVAEEYFDSVILAAKNQIAANIQASKASTLKNLIDKYSGSVSVVKEMCENTYIEITSISNFINKTGEIKKEAEDFIKSVFDATDVIGKDKEAHMLSNYLSDGNFAMHPNAVRYLLYILLEHLEKEKMAATPFTSEDFNTSINRIIASEQTEKYQVALQGGKETNLESMCKAIDSLSDMKETMVNKVSENEPIDECRKMLNSYYTEVVKYFYRLLKSVIVGIAYDRIKALSETYEDFYKLFGTKAYSIEKKRNEIAEKLKNKPGNCVYNLFASKALLEVLSEKVQNVKDENGENELYKNFYRAMRENTEIRSINNADKFSKKIETDVFNDIIIKSFKNSVENACAEIIDLDVLRAMKLEYETIKDLELSRVPKDDDETRNDIRRSRDDGLEVLRYINDTIKIGMNLAAPSICRNDFEENREVSAIAYSDTLTDFGEVEIASLFEPKNAENSVSRYELRFFRSVYGLTPIQISRLCSPAMSKEALAKCIDIGGLEGSTEIGDYFVAYQDYMEDIGPDCKLNALITPHIDKSWNSISVMPELDLEYQSSLMQNIHQAFFYGFLFDIIELFQPSTYDENTLAYRYFDKNNNAKNFTVSNGTLCDKFDEVLDSLYFDRAAVKAIKEIACANRAKDKNSRVSAKETGFYKALESLSRTKMLGEISVDTEQAEKLPTSMFEIPLMYYNSLMISDDMDEIIAMTNAIIGAVKFQLSSKEKGLNLEKHVAQIVVAQHNLLLENYMKLPEFLGMGVDITSNDAIISIHKLCKQYVEELLPNGNGLKTPDEVKSATKKGKK